MCSINHIDEYDAEHCTICGRTLDLESCWHCLGDGGFHNCGEDTCVCLDPEELNEICDECDGEGAYLVCPADEHHPRREAAP